MLEFVTAFATLVLVAVTAYYAWQARQMVVEMRSAREAQYSPILVPRIALHTYFGHVGRYVVQNAGGGPALAVNVHLRFQPGQMEWRLQTTAMAAGELRPFSNEGRVLDFDIRKHEETHSSIRLVGQCKDRTGKVHKVDLEVPLRELSDMPLLFPSDDAAEQPQGDRE